MSISETPLRLPVDSEENLTDLLESRVSETPDRVLFSTPNGDSWTDITAAEFRDQVVALAKGLVAQGLEPGDHVGLMCSTRYEWTLIDFAVMYAGGLVIPIYETSSALQIHWTLKDSGAKFFLVENEELYERFTEVKDDLPDLRRDWVLSRGTLEQFVIDGREVLSEEIERRRNIAGSDDPATIIYTSGSFGRPKGCVLTHGNFVVLCRNIHVEISEVTTYPGASTLLFVTLAHVFARMISMLAISSGIRVGHSDTTNLLASLGTFQPTFLLAVPRVFEKVYNSAEQKAESSRKGKVFRLAAQTAVDYSRAQDAGKIPLPLKLKYRLFDKLVYAKLKALLGGQAKFAISGSAPLSTFLGHFYKGIGLQILEGYGLTETTAPATVNRPGTFKIGTVGSALPGVSVRIGDQDEVQVKGESVFKEYWNNPEATAEAFTDDGYLKTGDTGTIDEDGYLKITGRIKELIVTAGGKNVAPAVLEDVMRSNTIIAQPIVVGDQKPYIAAIVTLDTEMLPQWLSNHGLDPEMPLEEAAKNDAVIAEVQRTVDTANQQVSRAESIRKFVILPVVFTEANGHLTPKMSIKRANILKDFAGEIEALYGPNPNTAALPTARPKR